MSTSVLLLIDVQRDMLLPPAPVPDAEEVGAVIAGVLARARAAGAPVVHIRNAGGPGDPDEPGTPGWELVHEVREGEHVVDKAEQDAFAGTSLADLLPQGAPLVVAGMQSEYCVRATALTALARGHAVTLVAGGHSTYDDGEAAAAQSLLTAAGVTAAALEDVRF